MKLSDEGHRLLIEREGCKLQAYKDSVGVWTIGVGHTSGAGPPHVKQGMKITQAEAEEIFINDVAEFVEGLESMLEGKPIEQHQFDAFTSLAFNIGLGAFAESTTLRWFKAGDIEGAARALLWWDKPPEIKSRRRGEHQQFLGIKYVARI
jgi:lysozyme